MAGRRDQITMTPAEIDAFLATERTLQVAASNGDGTPHLVAMWFTRYRGKLAFWTYAKSQKVVNLRRDPRLTVMVESGEVYEELKGVTIYGTACIVDDLDDVLAFGDVLYERYWGPIDTDETRERVRTMGRKRALILVEPTKIVSWDHTKLGGSY